MAEFLHTTHEIYSRLDEMIREASRFIVIVSPFISFEGQQLVLLKKAAEKGVQIRIVYRLDNTETERNLNELSDFPSIKILGCPELHAKIYATEDVAIISSKNLTARTTVYSVEVGILYEVGEEFYDMLIQTVNDIGAIPTTEILFDNTEQQRGGEQLGYCIRCGMKGIKLNKDYPFCTECFEEWNKHRNYSCVENFCHFCGKKAEGITYNKPVEIGCYSKYLEEERAQWYSSFEITI